MRPKIKCLNYKEGWCEEMNCQTCPGVEQDLADSPTSPLDDMVSKQDSLSVIESAIDWWESLRPKGWDENRHLQDPEVNTTSESQKKLARSIADHLF